MILFFDTETTGTITKYMTWENYPRLVQIGWVEYELGEESSAIEYIVKPDGFEIPISASAINHITTEQALRDGARIDVVLGVFANRVRQAESIIGHNLNFDLMIVGAELKRLGMESPFKDKPLICTMKQSTEFCKLPGGMPYKWPKLHELYAKLFNCDMGDAHNALIDIKNTAKCYFELKRIGVIQ
jgi:DNA polymerase III epsilon subunit-like protein